ncbi:MAG: hypothetical protein ACUVR4_15310 [Anaerolineae bacterium]
MNLPPPDVDLFYRLRDSLLAFANRELKILPAGTLPDQVRKHSIQEIVNLRNACYEKPALLEQYLAANPDRFPANELAIVASWRHRITGDFYIIRHLKAYTVFMSLKEPEHLYGVLGLIDPLEVVLGGAPLPFMVEATLLPFRDRIIYDGILNPYRIFFGPGIRRSANATYNRLKEREGIIESLVGPDGQPQIRTSLARKTPAKAAPDWRPAVDEIVAQAEKMRQTDTKLQGAAFGLLRAAASLAQATLLEQGAEDEATKRMKAVRTALTKVERLLYEGEW